MSKPRDPMQPTEAQIQSSILEYLAIKHVFAWRNNSRVIDLPGKGGKERPVRFGGMKGSSDILGCWNGRFLAIEVKDYRGEVSEAQQDFINQINEAGGMAFVARTLDDVIRMIG